jgi:hypothetical protein
MGPIETLRDVCGRYYANLKKEGLNPFDLFNRDFLLNIDTETLEAGKRDLYDEVKLHRWLRKLIQEALDRKDRTAMKRHLCAAFYRDLKNDGLNPLDLFNWDALLNIEEETFQAGRRGYHEDEKLHKHLRKALWEALERKAEDIDMESGEDCVAHLKSLKHNRRNSVVQRI